MRHLIVSSCPALFSAGFILSAFLIFSFTVGAYEQSEEICYSQCAAYKFYWDGDSCWDFIQMNCGMGKVAFAGKVISMLKEVRDALKTGAGTPAQVLSIVTRALVCGAVINQCIEPKLDACSRTCESKPYYYAPNLRAGTASSGTSGVSYSKTKEKLYFHVGNSGAAYAWDIPVRAKWGSTPERNGEITNYKTLFEETIEQILFWGARQSAPRGAADIVKDFLIDQSNFSNFLSKFKSRAGQEVIPPFWVKEMDFTVPDGELTRVILEVDPENVVPETNEEDNVYVFELDDRPTPPNLSIRDHEIELTGDDLSVREAGFSVFNIGEEGAIVKIEIYDNSTPYLPPLVSVDAEIGQDETFSWRGEIPVSIGKDSCASWAEYLIEATDQYGKQVRRTLITNVHSGSVAGRVEDRFGDPVVGATITTNLGHEVETDERGYYQIRGITELGELTVTASHPSYNVDSSRKVDIDMTVDPDSSSCADRSLHRTGIGLVLENAPAEINFAVEDFSDNPIENAKIIMINDDFRYELDLEDGESLSVEPEVFYQVFVTAPGYLPYREEVGFHSGDHPRKYTLRRFDPGVPGEVLEINKPKLLWEKDLTLDDGYQIARYAASKDGNLLLLYTVNPGEKDSGRLHFIDTETGNTIKVVPVLSSRGNPHVELDVDWGGDIVAYFTSILADYSGDPDRRRLLKLFDGGGNELLSRDFGPGSLGGCDVSPDGYYIYPGELINKDGYTYTEWHITGDEYGKDTGESYRERKVLHFLPDNSLLAGCRDGEGYCRYDIFGTELGNFPDIGTARSIDSSADGETIAFQTNRRTYFYDGGSLMWDKEQPRRSRNYLVSVSPDGEYVAVMNALHDSADDALKVFDREGNNVTSHLDFSYTKFAIANEKGIFFLKGDWRKGRDNIQYYQLAGYTSE